MKEVFILKAVYSIGIIVMEIPSGYVSDAWGRRKSLILGAILGCLGFVIYSLGAGFWFFLLAEITLGIGQSFISGSDSAMLYDSLNSMNRSDEYLKLESRTLSIGNFGEAIAGITAGVIASYSLHLPFIFQAFIASIAIPASLLLVRPENEQLLEGKGKFKEIIMIFKYSLIENKLLKWNIIMSSVIGCSTLSIAWFIQPYLKELNIGTVIIGIIWTLLNLTVGTVSLLSNKINDYLGNNKTCLLIVAFISISYMLIGRNQSIIGIGILFILYASRGVATPILKNNINILTESKIRATVLSIRNFFIRFIFAIITPCLGWYADEFSISSGIVISGMVFFILGFGALFRLFYYRRKIKSKVQKIKI
jgi:MFS family permease